MTFTLRRPASRVILFDPDRRVWLINGRDPGDPTKPPWWEIPGGGIDPGEPSAETAARELGEECGFTEVVVGPVVATQYVEFDFAGIHFESDEVVHVATTEQLTPPAPRRLEALEVLALGEARWWTAAEIESSDEAFLPPWLPTVIARLAAGDLPEEPLRF